MKNDGIPMVKNPELYTLAITMIAGALASGLHSEHDISLVHDAAHDFADFVDGCDASSTAAQIAVLATAQSVAQNPGINGSTPLGAHDAFTRYLKLGAQLESSLADRLGFTLGDGERPSDEESESGDAPREDSSPSSQRDDEETTG